MAANAAQYELLTPEQVARLFGKTTDTLRRWRDAGTGPRHVKIGGSIRYRREDVEQYIAENTRSSTNG